MAEERKEMVSYILHLFIIHYLLGTIRETFAIKKQADKFNFRREQHENEH